MYATVGILFAIVVTWRAYARRELATDLTNGHLALLFVACALAWPAVLVYFADVIADKVIERCGLYDEPETTKDPGSGNASTPQA